MTHDDDDHLDDAATNLEPKQPMTCAAAAAVRYCRLLLPKLQVEAPPWSAQCPVHRAVSSESHQNVRESLDRAQYREAFEAMIELPC